MQQQIYGYHINNVSELKQRFLIDVWYSFGVAR